MRTHEIPGSHKSQKRHPTYFEQKEDEGQERTKGQKRSNNNIRGQFLVVSFQREKYKDG